MSSHCWLTAAEATAGGALVWISLLALLVTTIFAAYWPLGAANTVIAIAIAIATAKAAIVAVVFMELRERHSLTVAFAGAGFFWLGIMLWLAMGDYVTGPNFPAAQPIGVSP